MPSQGLMSMDSPMDSDHRAAAWDILLHEAHAVAERTRQRLRDLQARYHLPEQMLRELDEADVDLTDTDPAPSPPAETAVAPPPAVGEEPPVSPPTRGLHLMQEIYLKCLAPSDVHGAGRDWGLAITNFPCTVGRHPECGARIDHPMISRRHCSLFLDQDQIGVEDLGSRNGTMLNGQRLQSRQPVKDGDRLELAGLPFEVRLPVSPATPIVQPEALKPAAEPTGPSHRVLVVEDNAGAAAALGVLLQNWGHLVRIAHSGPEALRAARVDPPDTVLLDICLPGMDGYHVAEQLRAETDLKKARLVAMTGYEPADDNQPHEKFFDCLITKPVDLQALQRMLT